MKITRLFKSAKSFGLATAATVLMTSLFIVPSAYAYSVLDTNSGNINTWSVVCPSGYSLYKGPNIRSRTGVSVKKYDAIRITFTVRYQGPKGSVRVGVHTDAADSIFRTPYYSEKFTMSDGQERRFDVRIPRSAVLTANFRLLGVQAIVANHPYRSHHRGYISLDQNDYDCTRNGLLLK